MRKQKWICIGISILLLGITGCTLETNNIDTTPTTIVEKKENTKTPTATIVPKPTTIPTPSIVEFSAKDFNSFNRMLTADGRAGSCGKSLFCVDEQTGITYFVNQGEDYYLYQMKSGEVKVVVPMPVKEIYPYGDLVYFMIDDYNKYDLQDMNNGDIYCYDSKNNTIELVYEAGAIENSEVHKLFVEETGLYFYYEEEESRVMHSYYLPFGETEPIIDKQYIPRKGWGKYWFSYNPKLILETRPGTGEEKETLELFAEVTSYCVVGDILYSAERTYISCINLVTGERTGYDFLEEIKKVEGQEKIDDTGFRIIESFVITKDSVWITTGSYLYCMDLKNGEVECVYILDKQNNPCYIATLYTNGEEVYGVQEVSKDTKKLVRILTKEIEKESLFGLPVIRVEDAVQ